jgi:uncharacterized protein
MVLIRILGVFRRSILKLSASVIGDLDPRQLWCATLAIAATLGVLVSISSVGAGALGTTVVVMLYPRYPIVRIVGSDIAHAVPLTLLAGFGHWLMGSVNGTLLGSLLVGSIPGILLGSWAAARVPDAALRYVLAVTLLVAGANLIF